MDANCRQYCHTASRVTRHSVTWRHLHSPSNYRVLWCLVLLLPSIQGVLSSSLPPVPELTVQVGHVPPQVQAPVKQDIAVELDAKQLGLGRVLLLEVVLRGGVLARLHVLLAHLRRVGRISLDELVAHDVEGVRLRLEADVDDKVVELAHVHLHGVVGGVLRLPVAASPGHANLNRAHLPARHHADREGTRGSSRNVWRTTVGFPR